MVPNPCEIIKAGGTIIDSKLIVEAKNIFITCTVKRREIINIICLEVIVDFSFLETNIKIPQLPSTSKKVKIQEKISEVFKGVESKNL